jgi:ubiquinol oxidase
MATRELGPISSAVKERPPFGPMEQLDHDALVREQRVSLSSPRRKASLSARLLFAIMDAVYGKGRTLEKFRVLELVARAPYQAWENVAYIAMTHTAREPGFARRVFDRVRTSRWEQDNEQWHLLILEELTADGPRRPWVRSRLVPQVLAFAYYQLSWVMFAIRPAWSYRLNADFEDHAEHEYAHLVEEHPEWESTPYQSAFSADFGTYASRADLFRQIGYDERMHKEESELRMRQPRFE